MKKVMTILVTLIVLSSCSSITQKDDGKISIQNGSGENVSIPFKIMGEITTAQITKSDVQHYARMASIPAKNACKYQLTFTPQKIEIYENDDKEIVVAFQFSAQNAYGVAGLHTVFDHYKNGKQCDETLIN